MRQVIREVGKRGEEKRGRDQTTDYGGEETFYLSVMRQTGKFPFRSSSTVKYFSQNGAGTVHKTIKMGGCCAALNASLDQQCWT